MNKPIPTQHYLRSILLLQIVFACRCVAVETTVGDIHLSGSEEDVIARLEEIVADPEAHPIESLSISHTRVTERVTSLISRLPYLQALEVGGEAGTLETFVDVGAYRKLSKLRRLRSLRLIECVDSPYGKDVKTSIAFVGDLSKLEHLELELSVSDRDLSRIVRLPNLKSIVFWQEPTVWSKAIWYELIHKPSLQEFVVESFHQDFSIRDLFADPSDISLKKLSLVRYTQKRTCWSSHDVEALATIKGLTSLKLGLIESHDIALLTSLEHLEDLDIRANGHVDGIPVVRSSQSMRKLVLFCDSFVGHRDLSGHPSLDEIRIVETSKLEEEKK